MNRHAAPAMLKAVWGLLGGLPWLLAGWAHAIAPAWLPDEKLVQSPIIMVAQWEKAAIHPHNQIRKDPELGEVVIGSEAYTTLHVLRVIKGPGWPVGDHELMIGWGVSWSKEGTFLNSGTSTQLPGEVEDLTKPALWFLSEEPSWDKARPGNHLAISHYRRIQPLELEAYFAALGSKSPETEVPKLLSPDKPEVTFRVLQFISGGELPWPYEPGRLDVAIGHPEHRTARSKDQAARVLEIVHSNAGPIRSQALSVYADLMGVESLDAIRPLLDDPDPLLRGTAIGLLARHHDEASLGRFELASRGVEEGWLACKLIDAMAQWGDERLSPSLMTFLQNGELAYRYGDDFGVPALKARLTLKKITNHWFPPDVDRSIKAWQQAVPETDRIKREALLQKLLPGWEFPLVAELSGEPMYAKTTEPSSEQSISANVRIRNVTENAVILAKCPAEVSLTWPSGCSDAVPEDAAKNGGFATLKPGESLELVVKLNESFLLSDPAARSIKLGYYGARNSASSGAWIGVLNVVPGSLWKETRNVAQVEECWPNGNLKATGTTINGHKTGEWSYFNEAGDRIRTDGAVLNPDHPANKGAGLRPPKADAPH